MFIGLYASWGQGKLLSLCFLYFTQYMRHKIHSIKRCQLLEFLIYWSENFHWQILIHFLHMKYIYVCVCVCVFATNIYCSYTFAINIYLLFMYNNELLYKYAFFTFWFHHSYNSLKIHLLPLILINFNLFSFKITFQSILLVNLARISFMMWKYLWLFSPKQVT